MVSGVPEVWRRVGEPRVPRLITGGQWRSAAACRSADPDLFFPISDSGPARNRQRRLRRSARPAGSGASVSRSRCERDRYMASGAARPNTNARVFYVRSWPAA